MLETKNDCFYDLRHGDCVDVMTSLPANHVHLTVTSPPYWNQRAYAFWPAYEEYLADVYAWTSGLYRITKPGCYVFWVIPEKLPWPDKVNGGQGRLFKYIFHDTEYAAAAAGFICEPYIVWHKGTGAAGKQLGSYPYPRTTMVTPNTEVICTWRKPGKPDHEGKRRPGNEVNTRQWKDWAQDLWKIRGVSDKRHPAVFPQQIPDNIIPLWSFPGDIVFDPFTGSGTTAVSCVELRRSFIGAERDLNYYQLATERVLDTIAKKGIDEL